MDLEMSVKDFLAANPDVALVKVTAKIADTNRAGNSTLHIGLHDVVKGYNLATLYGFLNNGDFKVIKGKPMQMAEALQAGERLEKFVVLGQRCDQLAPDSAKAIPDLKKRIALHLATTGQVK